MSADDPRHGTLTGYNRIPCHEDCCRNAYARWRKEREHDASHGRRRVIDATGSRRRIEALQAIGWSQPALARHLGCSVRALRKTTEYPVIRTSKAARIALLYDALSMQLPPNPASFTRTIAYARQKGFAAPLAWDDDTIDDPDAVPHIDAPRDRDYIDEVSVRRLLNGERVDCTPAEREEVIRRWLADGRPVNELDRLTGWNVRRMLRLRRLAESGSAAA